MYADRLAAGVPGTYVVPVGPPSVATEPHEERSSESPGQIGVEFGDAEGSLGESGYCGVVVGRPGKFPVSKFAASH
jgi:hypothetical protein